MSKQPEGKLSTKIMKAMRRRGAWVMKVHGSEFQPAGVPDILGVHRGMLVGCETKMPGNKPSKIQEYRITLIRRAGGHVVVSYDVKSVSDMLDHIDDINTRTCDNKCLYTRLDEWEANDG